MPHSTPEGFTSGPLKAELPLDPLEAFRLASFSIEYVPRYAPIVWDKEVANARWFVLPGDRYVWAGGNYFANLDAFKRFYE